MDVDYLMLLNLFGEFRMFCEIGKKNRTEVLIQVGGFSHGIFHFKAAPAWCNFHCPIPLSLSHGPKQH